MRYTRLSNSRSPASAWLAARLFALCSVGAVVACSDPDPVCDICTTSAIIYGRVQHATGQPVAGNPILIEAHEESCASATIHAASEMGLVTGSDGSYRARLRAAVGPFTACPRVTIELPGSDPDRVTVDGPTVEFREDFGPNQRRDSVRVDVEVP
jgi:hypothetical protein